MKHIRLQRPNVPRRGWSVWGAGAGFERFALAGGRPRIRWLLICTNGCICRSTWDASWYEMT